MKNKTLMIKLKTEVWKLPNKMHFEIQKKTRAHIFKSRKGKGSYTRKNQSKTDGGE